MGKSKNTFTDEELLILSNYVYYDDSVNCSYIDEMLNKYPKAKGEPLSRSGGMNDEQAAALIEKIREQANKSDFGSIRATRVLNEGGVRAVCFEKENGDAAVVFRGTGGTYEAWEDNVIANYKSDTKMQKIAADFVKYDCGGYNNITLAGHSKGGNLAQYATVICKEKVNRCVSFDGQGMSNEFIEKHAKEISASRDKIVSVCADNDYVNIMLTSIAGATLYYHNKYYGPVGAHSSFSLLDSVVFDESGYCDVNESSSQDIVISALSNVLSFVTERMEKLEGDGEKIITNLIAAVVAGSPLCANRETNGIDEADRIKSCVSGVYDYVRSVMFGIDIEDKLCDIEASYVLYDPRIMHEAEKEYMSMISKVTIYIEGIKNIGSFLREQIVAYISLEYKLNGLCDKMLETLAHMNSIARALNSINACYVSAETQSLDVIGNIKTC